MIGRAQLAKMIRYLRVWQLATDVLFGWFMVSWFVTRHVLFMLVIWSTIYDIRKYIPTLWDPAQGFYLTASALSAFIAMLLALQVSPSTYHESPAMLTKA